MTVLRLLSIMTLSLAVLPAGAFAANDARAPITDEVVHQPTTIPEELTDPNDPAGPAFATDEAENPVEAAEDHGGGGLPQLNISTYPSQAFWLLLSFAVLYLVFAKSTLPSIGAVIGNREGKIAGDLAEAERLRAQAEDIQNTYEKGLERARADALAAVQQVELAAKQKLADQTDAFRKKSETEVKAAEERMDGVCAKAMGDMSAVAAEVASVAAEKITGVNTDVAKAKDIVDSIAAKPKAA